MDGKLKLAAESVTGALPVPLRPTVCGLFKASSVTVSVPVADPTAVGENVTPIVQLAPAAMLAPQVLLATAKPELVRKLEKFRVTFSRFVKVTVLAALMFPTATVPKLNELDEKVTGALPVPVRLTICVPALPAIVRDPEAEPTTVGVKETRIAQVPAGAMLAVQVFV